MSEVIQQARDLLSGRLSELQDETLKIERAIAELPLNGNGPSKRRAPGRPKGSKATKTRRPGVRKRRGRGTRADQAVNLIAGKPGITASEIAKAMKIKPNYLYRVLGDLEQEKRVKKDGRTYTAV